MDINLALLFLAFLGAFAIGYGAKMDRTSSIEDGSLIYEILLMAGGVVAIAAAVLMKIMITVVI